MTRILFNFCNNEKHQTYPSPSINRRWDFNERFFKILFYLIVNSSLTLISSKVDFKLTLTLIVKSNIIKLIKNVKARQIR